MRLMYSRSSFLLLVSLGLIFLAGIIGIFSCSGDDDDDDNPLQPTAIDGIWQYSYLVNGQSLGSGYMAFIGAQIVLRTWSGCPSIGHFLTVSNSNISIDQSGHVTGEYFAHCDTSQGQNESSASGDFTSLQSRYSFDLMHEAAETQETLAGTTTGHYPGGDTVYDFEAIRMPPDNDFFQEFTGEVWVCAPDDITLCLTNNRFKASLSWLDSSGNSWSGYSQQVPGYDDTGIFWFDNDGEAQMVVKVFNGCAEYHSFWVFAAAETEVEFTLQVTDTKTGQGLQWWKPRGSIYYPIVDTEAFTTCP